MTKFYFGLDLGQSQDYTALAIVEQPAFDKCHLRHLKRYPLGTPYPDIVSNIVLTLGRPEVGEGPVLVVDATGVGQPVVDMFHQRGLYPYAIKIHGGENVSTDGLEYRIPKRDLAINLQVFFQEGKLKIADGLTDGPTLVRELLDFKVKINTKTGHDSYEAWREGVHDDLVLAVAMACWVAKNIPPVPDGELHRNTEGWPEGDDNDGW